MTLNHKQIEAKWNLNWEKQQIYAVDEASGKPKCYVLDMFPYPSGSSMHVGHPRGYIATDIYSRFKRMNGFEVLHPMGWDAFGLPAEETAIKEKIHPKIVAQRNIKKFKYQLKMLGFDYDWSKEVSTADHKFYKQTQYLFLEFFRHGLAYNKVMNVNWCEELGTVLANEDIVDGKSERGGFPVVQRGMRQWVLAITKYADRLSDDLEQLKQWPERIKSAQKQWIGKSIGYEVKFFLEHSDFSLEVFTTRIETIFGVTYLALAPEHEAVNQLKHHIKNFEAVATYQASSKLQTELDKKKNTEKTGVVMEGVYVINPANNAKIPVWVSDYALVDYGTGIIMGVPAHDERDMEFAVKFNIPIIQVISESNELMNSGKLSGLTIDKAAIKIAHKVKAKEVTKYKIRDWVFSRQRYWGEPFPIIWVKGEDAYNKASRGQMKTWLPSTPVCYHDANNEKWFALPVLPQFLDAVKLPNIESYGHTGTGEGPLASISEWVNTFVNLDTGEVSNDLKTNGVNIIPAKRETNTMPQWAGSSWYYLRYLDNNNTDIPFAKEKIEKWCPVDIYSGADHATAHLIYARFWHKFLFDIGLVNSSEPFTRLEFLGYILDANGNKFSKRNNSMIKPDDVVEQFGADAFRFYEMFIGPFEQSVRWNENGPVGARRFIERVWKTSLHLSQEEKIEVEILLNLTIKAVGDAIESFKFNTAIPKFMIFLNNAEKIGISKKQYTLFLKILAPFLPFVTEELWEKLGYPHSIHLSDWPMYDEALIDKKMFELVIQINGSKKGSMIINIDTEQEEVIKLIQNDSVLSKKIKVNEIKKIIFVKNKIINFVYAS